MGFTVVQINIKNFYKNKYILTLEISRTKPDIILMNETGRVYNNNLKLPGYKTTAINTVEYDGIAILSKNELEIEHVFFENNDLLAIRIKSNFGPVIIATTYSPPRRYTLPIVSLNKLFSYEIPILLIADLNAKHPSLNIAPNNSKMYNPKGHHK